MFMVPMSPMALATVSLSNPFSRAWGSRCVPMSPLAVPPQMENTPHRSQKVGVLTASLMPMTCPAGLAPSGSPAGLSAAGAVCAPGPSL